MLKHLKNEANRTFTENGALTQKTTYSDCLDLFAVIGALRGAQEKDIVDRFVRAYVENADVAMKTVFFARDVRGGLGERRVFRVCMQWLAHNAADSVRKNLRHVAEYGRWDDLLCLMGTPCEKDALLLVKEQLDEDLSALEKGEACSLLAKWLPSVNASNTETVTKAKRIARFLGMTDADYRKTLVMLRAHIRILENDLREKDYSFDYSKQPSKAMFKYKKAFMRNDGERYGAYLSSVSRGEAKLNAATLMPYELVQPYLNDDYYIRGHAGFMRAVSEEERAMLNATWASLPSFSNEENALAVIDTSASMYWTNNPMPAAVALSLGLYFAQHNTGAFKNHFIEFSGEPQLIELKGETFVDQLQYASSFCQFGNTNLEAVFDLVLKAAVRNNVPQDELPSTLYIISDMEFDACVKGADITNFENAKAKFAAYGYQLPKIVFWNVQSRNRQQPVSQNEQGVALVSGCTPRLFNMIASGRLSPLEYMMDILRAERYAPIAA